MTSAMRASSWGDVYDYSRQVEEVTSVHSGDREALDDDVMLFGAGGVTSGPLPPTPNGGMVVSMPPVPHWGGLDAVCVAAGSSESTSPPVGPTPELRHHRHDREALSDTVANDTASFTQRSHAGHASSPLGQISRSSEELSLHAQEPSTSHGHRGHQPYEEYDDEDDDSSFFARNSEGVEDTRLSTSEMFRDEDEDSEDEDSAPLEVRRRRPSWSVAEPPPDSDSEPS